MEEPYLYQKIVADIQQQILLGKIKPGDRLPSIRNMVAGWACTPGTVQRAYQELARQGLVTSHAGKGTQVVDKPVVKDDTPLRRATLINRAETFLLEVLTAGFSQDEIQAALDIAWDHWRIVSSGPTHHKKDELIFSGSHDPVINWLAAHFETIQPETKLGVEFCGSLGGLIALAQGQADLAGCHLWDAETDQYNAPFVRRLLPGRRVALVTLANRRIGLIVPRGNPLGLEDLHDLTRPGLRFINRQQGSGTRVWLDEQINRCGITPQAITGYSDERMTHSDIARAIAQGEADVGFGLESAAISFGLDFIFLVQERYDLAAAQETMTRLEVLLGWIGSAEGRGVISTFGGYDTSQSGQIEWVE